MSQHVINFFNIQILEGKNSRERMGEEMAKVEDEMLTGQAQVWQLMFAFADSMALRSAVELRIPDILHSHPSPITISQIASSIGSPSPNIPYLTRVMRLLARRKIFAAHHPSGGGDPLYGPTSVSAWLRRETTSFTLAPMFLMETHPYAVKPWQFIGDSVKDGGFPFEKANGHEIWEFAARNEEFNGMFNAGMACTSRVVVAAVLEGYKNGFDGIGSVVDVGGGTGSFVAEIVKAHPHIRGINFDLPHVVATAPERDRVSHVGGDMFQAVPHADAVIMKWIMHDWADEDCVKILKNCRKAITEKTGKVIIVEVVLKPEGNGLFDDIGFVFDLLMIAHCSGGRERTEPEWKKILEEAGFSCYKIVNIPALTSIIEAYPE